MLVKKLKTNGNNFTNNEQYVVEINNKIYFQSYKSVVAVIENGTLTLGRDWDYSKTTMRYVNKFIDEYLHFYCLFNGIEINTKGIRKAIEKGLFKYDSELI